FTPNAGFTGQESFSYSISDGQGGSATATETINVSAAPTLSVGDDTQVEGTNLVHTVSLSNPSSTAQSYAISLTGNTATAGTDFDNVLANAVFSNGVTYDAGTGQITVPAGVTSFTVGYATTQDNIFEADETTTLTIGGSTGTGTITNDDAVPTLSVGDDTQVEGTNLVHTVSLSNPSSTAQSYAISLT
ncbi:Ig-like domain-containing protein, partial [Acinetobacter baumannii]|uniref:Ig-like domain-containing protein n=2 Tax=Acinetobacter TaxID=469 RepID=UPI0038914B53